MSYPLCHNKNQKPMNTSPADIELNLEPGTPNPEPQTQYPEPSPELIADIRQRLTEAKIPAEVIERAHQTLMHDTIDAAGRLLYRAGLCLCSAELYEYRKTLFPPNSLLDPLTAGKPVLRNPPPAQGVEGRMPMPEPLTNSSPDSLSASTQTNPEPQSVNSEPPIVPTSDLRPPTSAGATLLSDLRDVIRRYVVLPEMAAETLALWVVHTYAFTLRQVTTYIGVVSPEKRCGKTTLLELLGLLANRSLTAANISPSAMFRVIEDTQPTLLIDEADTFLEGRDELAGILNAGYRKGNSYVVRVADRKARGNSGGTNQIGGTSYTSPQSNPPVPEFAQWTSEIVPSDPTIHSSSSASAPHSTNPSIQNPNSSSPASIHSSKNPSIHPPNPPNPCNNVTNHHVTTLARYSCWCPKVMAAIGRLPDTLADRCILITMQRKMPGEKCERMRHLNAEDLRIRCDKFVRAHADQIAHAQPEIPATLNDRAADIWEPLLAIADLAGGEWPQLARAAAQKLSTHDDELTPTGYFLKDLRNLMVLAGVDRMLCRDIVKQLNPMHNRPWEDLRRGREINEWWLGRLLGELGIHSRSTRAGDATGKGYTLADIDAAFRRYVPNPDLHTTLPPPEPASENASASGTAPATDAQTEKDILKLMQQLMTQPKPS